MLSHKDSRIRGDIADLLGKTGDPRAIPKLEPLKADPDPDVADAAVEAIEELRKLQ
jgi:HEAT repeat protein